MATVIGTLAVALVAPDSVRAAVLQPVAQGFERPVHVTSAPNDPDRLFVVERDGVVWLVTPSTKSVVLDLSSQLTSSGSEQGLLSIALAPDFETTGLLYVFYTRNSDNALQIDELRVSGDVADPTSRRSVITLEHPAQTQHNGGQLQFGPDGYLYIGTGDGVVDSNGQDLGSPLGKILRIDPRAGGGSSYTIPSDNPFLDGDEGTRDEIWAYGFRNPWRFSFDRETGDLWIADVGEESWEEVDFAPAPGRGSGWNFGWACREGHDVFQPQACDPQQEDDYVDPIFAYPHDPEVPGKPWGVAITGGYVVRDPSLPDLAGRYLYADYGTGEIRSLAPRATGANGERSERMVVENPTSFGEDAAKRIYVVSFSGTIYRITADISLRLTAKRGRIAPSKRARLLARVRPCPGRAGATVSLRRDGKTIASRTLNEACKARFRARVKGKRSRFRVVLAGEDRDLVAISKPVRVREKQKRRR